MKQSLSYFVTGIVLFGALAATSFGLTVACDRTESIVVGLWLAFASVITGIGSLAMLTSGCQLALKALEEEKKKSQ